VFVLCILFLLVLFHVYSTFLVLFFVEIDCIMILDIRRDEKIEDEECGLVGTAIFWRLWVYHIYFVFLECY